MRRIITTMPDGTLAIVDQVRQQGEIEIGDGVYAVDPNTPEILGATIHVFPVETSMAAACAAYDRYIETGELPGAGG